MNVVCTVSVATRLVMEELGDFVCISRGAVTFRH